MYGLKASNPPESLLFDLLNQTDEYIETFINVNKMLSKEGCDLLLQL